MADALSAFRGPRRLSAKERAANRTKTLKALCAYFYRERRWFFSLLAVVTIGVIAGAAAPVLLSRAIDLIAGGDYGALPRLLALMVALYLFFALMAFFQGRLGAILSQRIIRRLRADLYERINGLPIRYLDTHAHGDLLSRMTNDADTLASVISNAFSALFADILTILAALVVMLSLSVPLTLATASTALLSLALTRFMASRGRKYFAARQELLGAMGASAQENMTARKTLIAYGREQATAAVFNATADQLTRAGIRAEILGGSMGPLMNAIGNLAFLIVTVFGAYLALAGHITIGVISAFLIYARQFSRPITEIAQLYGQIETALAGAERIFALFEEPLEDPAGRPLTNLRGEIAFSHVDFGYTQDAPVLRDFSLTIGVGKRVALVGTTGSGKTTVTNLLLRFYDPTGGQILLDGVDISEYSRHSLRQSIGIVLQDTVLFTGTIRENIAFGRPEATMEEITAAARLASADTFIRQLPEGYDTVISQEGGTLSSGQRQLLAIARACLVDPRILILDEATSSVDTRTEKHIQDALLRLMRGRTCLIIAHRLSTITEADEIIVLDGGRIVERGRHQELLAKKGRYAELIALQLAGQSL